MMQRLFICLATGVTFIWLGACANKGKDDKDQDTSRPATFGFQTSLHQTLIDEGKAAYQRYCIGCHGATGDGKGEAAPFLSPVPRNFVTAGFKFSSTRSGQLPTDDDLRRTIKNGLRGSAMPAFNLLPDRTIEALVAYIKTLSPRWSEQPPGAPVPVVDDPFAAPERHAEGIARGEAVYHGFANCWSCHPAYVSEAKLNEYLVQFGGQRRDYFRPNLDQSEGKPNEEGEMVYPPDFRRDFVRAGMTLQDIYRSIAAGITGTAMPTWVDSIEVAGRNPGDPPLVTRADLWAMARYVQSLMKERPPLVEEGQVQLRNRPRSIFLHDAPASSPTAAPAATQPAVDFEF